jgi:hypothetical protein
MFLLDSLMISGIRWALETTLTAAEAEMNDDTALREQLLAAEMSREMGEISDGDFAQIEADLLARIREIKERREGGSGPLAFGGAEPIETDEDSRFQLEASVSGDFHDPVDAPHTTVVGTEPRRAALGHLIEARSGEEIAVLDMEPGDAAERALPASPHVVARRRPPLRRARKAPARPAGKAAAKTKTASRSARSRRRR